VAAVTRKAKSSWSSLRKRLLRAGWTPAQQQKSSDALRSPHDAIIVNREAFENPVLRQNLKESLRRQLTTLYGYREGGFNDPHLDGAMADFHEALEYLDAWDRGLG
jgi:hypothetical protein